MNWKKLYKWYEPICLILGVGFCFGYLYSVWWDVRFNEARISIAILESLIGLSIIPYYLKKIYGK